MELGHSLNVLELKKKLSHLQRSRDLLWKRVQSDDLRCVIRAERLVTKRHERLMSYSPGSQSDVSDYVKWLLAELRMFETGSPTYSRVEARILDAVEELHPLGTISPCTSATTPTQRL